MGALPPPSVRLWIAVALVAVATVALYAPSLSGGFLADDVFYLRTLSVEDGALTGAWAGPLLGSPETTFYRPLPLASLAVELAAWGVDRALGFRLVNLLIHLLNAFLVGSIAARVLASGRAETGGPDQPALTPAAIVAGGLFALHPLAPEAVAWISGRFDLLATLFSLLALRLVLGGAGGRRPTRARLAYGLALASFAAALASKESAIGLPLAVAAWVGLVAWAPGRERRPAGRADSLRTVWAAVWPFVAVAAGYLALRVWALGTLVGGYRDAPLEWWQKEFWTVRLLAVLALALPHPLLYEVPKKLAFCLLAYPALGTGALALLRHRSPAARRTALFATIWLVATLAPHFPVLALRPTLENARILYLATAPFALFVAVVLTPSGASRPATLRSSFLAPAALALTLAAAAALLAHNLAPWVEAGRTTRSLRREVVALAETLPEGTRAVVEGVPDHVAGALVLRNGEALGRAPFVPPAIDGRVELRVGESQGPATAACDSPGVAVFRWEVASRSLVPADCG